MHGSAWPLVFVICEFITSLSFAVAAAVVILLVYILPALLDCLTWNIGSLGLFNVCICFAFALLCLPLSMLSFPGCIQSSGEKRREENHR